VVEISVPLRTDFIATLRTVAASTGADAGFSIDEIDDLRLAISEVVSSLADADTASDDRVDVSFRIGASEIAVTITTRRGETAIELDDLASSILHSVVDELVVDGPAVTLVKQASEAAGVRDADADHTAPNA
jgi:serine/threonine-protein kinase RsbW